MRRGWVGDVTHQVSRGVGYTRRKPACADDDDVHALSMTEKSDSAGDESPRGRFLEIPVPSRGAAIAVVVRGVVPLGLAFLAYALVGHQKADLTSIQNLIQLAVALVAGVASYTIITEITLERLPGRLSKELAVIEKRLRPVETRLQELTDQLAAVSVAVGEQLRNLVQLHGMEVLFEPEQALARARELQKNARSRVDAMWTLLPYDDSLKTYFAETLASGRPYTSRVIAARTVSRADLLQHIDSCWDRLANETYEIHLVHDCNYEALVVDKKTAGLYIYSDRGFQSCFLSSSTEDFVDAVQGLIQGLRREDWRVPIRKGDAKDLAKIGEWLDNYYQALTYLGPKTA
jgi:hypothetical protein